MSSSVSSVTSGICSVDLSSGKMTNNRIDSGYGYNDGWGSTYYSYTGFGDLDSMFNKCVTENIDTYSYESTVR